MFRRTDCVVLKNIVWLCSYSKLWYNKFWSRWSSRTIENVNNFKWIFLGKCCFHLKKKKPPMLKTPLAFGFLRSLFVQSQCMESVIINPARHIKSCMQQNPQLQNLSFIKAMNHAAPKETSRGKSPTLGGNWCVCHSRYHSSISEAGFFLFFWRGKVMKPYHYRFTT